MPWHGDTRLPDGVQVVSQDGDTVHMQVTMPMDEHGFFGRQCPSCSQLFRVEADDYMGLPDELELWCVYCGHHDGHSEFVTEQQLERAKSAVGAWATQSIAQTLDDSFSRMATPQPRGGFGVQVAYRSAPFGPEPLPGIDEEQLIRIRQCTRCALRYAVFSDHRFCPVCGPLAADVVALDALAAETTRLDALAQLPAETIAVLREQGVFTRLWVDTLENLVGVVETLAGAVYRASVTAAAQQLNGKGAIFQRLTPTAELFVAAGYPDLRQVLDPRTWQRLLQVWATRHLFTHHDGVVDEKYLAAVPTGAAVLGQRLTVTEPQTRQAIADARDLCVALAALTTTR